jgi:hypothetical protein
MGQDKSPERKLTESIEALLAGKPETVESGSDAELSSAVDFARTMVNLREDPPDELRAQLRARLAETMRAMDAVRQRAESNGGFFQWLRAAIQQRPLITALAGTAVIILVTVLSVRQFGHQQSATVGSGVPAITASLPLPLPARNVPSNASFVNETATLSAAVMSTDTKVAGPVTQATVYRVSKSDVNSGLVADLGRKLGFGGQVAQTDGQRLTMTTGSGEDARRLTVWIASGAIEYGFTSVDRSFPTTSVDLPSSNAAGRIAYDYLAGLGLLPPGFEDYSRAQGLITVTPGNDYGLGQGAKPDPGYWAVKFPYTINSLPVTGPGANVQVSVGSHGEVLNFEWALRQVIPAYDAPIRTSQQAYETLVRGGGSIDVPADSTVIKVRQIRLAYYADAVSEDQQYVQPVYEVIGESLDNTGRHLEDFRGWVPALTPS